MSVEEVASRLAAQGASRPVPARDPVNQAMVNNWVEAIGDANPSYTDAEFAAGSVHGGLVAPPAMAQVWTMRGLHGQRPDDDPLSVMTSTLDDAGYTSVVATNSEQTYHRYLRPGESVAASSRLESVVGPKGTALGEGWFVTTRTEWTVGGEVVAEMLFRVLKFRPPERSEGVLPNAQRSEGVLHNAQRSEGVLPNAQRSEGVLHNAQRSEGVLPNAQRSEGVFPNASRSEGVFPNASRSEGVLPNAQRSEGVLHNATEQVIRPVISPDTQFFWDGLRAGELRIQRWGEVLRHPPGPVGPGGDLDAKPDYVVASGRGTVYSFVVHHHPQVPGRQTPFVVVLVELEEGVRVLGELVDAEPSSVHIGLPVRATFLRVDDELTLPAWTVDA